ncbi:MAG TPA: MotA/TolQ/ExbB proton channel family protein [Gemmatimonadales bacterium]|nr:MotA/TolQ/ExbB proton channel family protein [Gemmatimonadales bacterium]
MHLSLLDLWNQMSWFPRGIVFVMIIMSVWSLGIAMNKWWKINRAQRETRKFAPEFSRFLQEDQIEGAIALSAKYKRSHVARTLAGALEEIKPLLTDKSITVADINSAERAIERNVMIIQSELKRGLGVLGTVGATAPFVGLLGTTLGIVNAFSGMAASGGSAGMAAVSAGIAEALITTAFGLLVAIPAVWLFNYFQTKLEFLVVEMTYSGKELVDYLIRGVGHEFGRSTFTKDFPAKVTAGSGHISK